MFLIAVAHYLKPKKNDLLGLFLIFFLVFAARLSFRQIAFWDWDQLLFASSLYEYNLWLHMPHPPGFPIWVLLIRLSHKIFHNEVTALVLVNVFFGSLSVFPLYYIFRYVAPAKVALAGVLLYVFNPVVWVEGESAFSDMTGYFWNALALAFLMRAQKNTYFYLGCFLLAIALGVRAQNVLLGVFILIPLWYKLRQRDFKVAALGVAIFGFTCLAWLIPTAIYGAGSITGYLNVIKLMTDETATSDQWSIHLKTLLDRISWVPRPMLISIWGGYRVAMALNFLAFVGLISYAMRKKWRELFLLLACFFPYFIFTALFFHLGYLKYTIPYIPLICFFIAVGGHSVASQLGRFRNLAFITGIFFILVVCTVKAYPALRILHQEKSPIMAAIDYIRTNLSPKNSFIFYFDKYHSFARHSLKDFQIDAMTTYHGDQEKTPAPGMDAFVISAFDPEPYSIWSMHFRQTSGALQLLGDGRVFGPYHDVWLNKTDIVYIDFFPRPDGTSRWMAERGVCYLRNHDGHSDKNLFLKTYVPLSQFAQAPYISIYVDGQLLDGFYQATEEMAKVFSIAGQHLQANSWSKLEITIDQTFASATSDFAGEATGNLGLVLEEMVWKDASANDAISPSSADDGAQAAETVINPGSDKSDE